MTFVGESAVVDISWRVDPSASMIVLAVVRRLLPYLVEATVLPTALYYVGLVTLGPTWGIVAAASCTYLSVLRRMVLRQPVPGLLLMATVGISIRLGMYLVNDSAFIYFIQPIVKTGAVALLFASSVVVGKPLVARFAADFCAFGSDVGDRPAIVSLFRRLTVLWAAAQILIAVADMALLLTVPISVFVGTAAGIAWAVMSAKCGPHGRRRCPDVTPGWSGYGAGRGRPPPRLRDADPLTCTGSATSVHRAGERTTEMPFRSALGISATSSTSLSSRTIVSSLASVSSSTV